MALVPTLVPSDNWNIFSAASWGDQSNGISLDDDEAYRLSGDYAWKFVGVTTAFYSDPQPVVVGRYYRLRAAAYFVANNATNDKFMARAELEGLGGSILCTASASVAPPTTGWRYFDALGFVDPGLISVGDCNAIVRLERPSGAGSSAIYVDHAILEPALGVFRVRRATSDQSVSNTTDTDVVFNSASLDPAGAGNLSTGIFTAPYASRWSFTTGLDWSAMASGTEIRTNILVNGSQVAQTRLITGTTPNNVQCASGPIELAQGDEVKVQVRHNSGGSETISSNAMSFFAGHEV